MWAAHNVREVLGAKAAENDQHVAMFGVTRCYDLAPFVDRDVELMRRYTGHLAAALRIAKHLQNMQTNAIAGYGLMRASGRPMFLLDRSCNILSMNDLAEDMVQRSDTFTIRGGALHCVSPENRNILLETMAETGIDHSVAEAKGRRKRTGIRLHRSDGAMLLCSVWDLRPESTMGAFGTRPAVLLTVAHPKTGNHVDPVWLGSLLDLSPAEVRVASGLMRGDALGKIAASLRLSVETVRSQLKSIYAKTDTHRQSELVALLLRLAAP
ncbi:MAG: helix-turn-helix transcriptional regulator [Terriglobia bacterium]